MGHLLGLTFAVCPLTVGNSSDLERDDVVRKSEITLLISIAEAGLAASDDKAVVYAVRRLGTMRAAEAAPLLVKHIKYAPRSNNQPLAGALLPLSEAMPCLYALGKIGSPCYDPLLKWLSDDNDTTNTSISHAATVFNMSLGCDDSVALIRARAAKAGDPNKAARLTALADWIGKPERKVNCK